MEATQNKAIQNESYFEKLARIDRQTEIESQQYIRGSIFCSTTLRIIKQEQIKRKESSSKGSFFA